MPKHRRTPDRILRKRLSDLVGRDADKASEYQDNHDRIPNLAVDQMYRVDPRMSRIPTAVCGNVLLGLPACHKGMNKHCYCKEPCANQYSLTSTDFQTAEFASKESKKLSEMEVEAAIQHAHDVMKYQRPELEIDIDEICTYLLQSIQDEIEGRV